MLIRNAEIEAAAGCGQRVDVSIVDGKIAALLPAGCASALDVPLLDAPLLDAQGAALLPGLHDHHMHLMALAAALDSLVCGPPEVHNEAQLIAALQNRAAQMAGENTGKNAWKNAWIRGIAYHPSVAGEIDRAWLDRVVPDHPVRIQHRSGRLWILNRCALERLGASHAPYDPVLELCDGQPSGRLYAADAWLRARLETGFPSLQRASALLASFGVTGVTDATPHNDCEHAHYFLTAQQRGELWQTVYLMGTAALDYFGDSEGVRRGPTKFHLHENDLPDFDGFCAAIQQSHAAGRAVAIHCVTLTELVFSASALATVAASADSAVSVAGMAAMGDRIEHAAIAPPDTLERLAKLGVTVVTQPNFIRERGDAYRLGVPVADQPYLYRLRGLQAAGIALAGSTDAPFGAPNPWAAMQAAVDRQTQSGAILGAQEALSPEAALALFSAAAHIPGGPSRRIAVGAPADLCLLDRPWAQARKRLDAVRVMATFKAGKQIFLFSQ